MSYAIIGFGKIGHALAKAFARKGIEVSVAPLRTWEDSRLPSSSRRLLLAQNWSRASTIWSLPSSTKIRPYMVAGESCSWRATMTAPQTEIGALAENLGFAPIKLGGLSEGGLLVQARGNSWGRLIFKDLVKFD